jgi:CRISPR-associated protein Csb3
MSIRINVDPTNPGQFFACCGLLELADRLWAGAEGWFENRAFHIDCSGGLSELLNAAKAVTFDGNEDDNVDEEENANDNDSVEKPLLIISPIHLRLDWWQDKTIKTWAGSMKVGLIAVAMANAIDPTNADPLNQSQVVYDPPKAVVVNGPRKNKTVRKKREPYCFDARRGMNSHSLDIGFSPNDLKMTTFAFPVVEFLCLIGLQRCRPVSTGKPRVFTYSTWSWRCCPSLLPVAINGLVSDPHSTRYRFENGFRSGQKKHKAFHSAISLS